MNLNPNDEQLVLSPIDYQRLNSRQKEAYNFQKISAVLADFGYCTIRLSDDWGGADFIAQHIDGSVLKVQLKGRLYIVLPENWTGGLDGESEETRTPSGEIYETTT
jgi:hypothetical protein